MTTTHRPDAGFDLVNVLGQRLRERRRELGLTLAEVAAEAGISVGHSSAIEKGNTLPSLSVLARLAHALQLTLAEVLRASPGPRIARGRDRRRAGYVAARVDGLANPDRLRLAARRRHVRVAVSPHGRRRLRVRPRWGDRDPRERRAPCARDRRLSALPRPERDRLDIRHSRRSGHPGRPRPRAPRLALACTPGPAPAPDEPGRRRRGRHARVGADEGIDECAARASR